MIAWHPFSPGETYNDLGGDYFDKRRRSPPTSVASSPNSKPSATKSPHSPTNAKATPARDPPRLLPKRTHDDSHLRERVMNHSRTVGPDLQPTGSPGSQGNHARAKQGPRRPSAA